MKKAKDPDAEFTVKRPRMSISTKQTDALKVA